MTIDPDRRLVTIEQACELTLCCRRTIYNWLHDGKLEFVRIPSGHIRIFEDSLFKPGTVSTQKECTV